jgi:hypothetical protein
MEGLMVFKDQDEIKKEIAPIVAAGEVLAGRIVDIDSYREGSEYLKRNKAAEKIIDDKIDPIRMAQYDAWQKTCALIKELKKPLEVGSRLVSTAMTRWKTEDDRLRRIEQERLAAEAKKRDDDARLAAAEAAEKAGEKEVAEAILNDPTPAPMPVVQKAEKVEGTFQRTTYKARVLDKKAFIAAVAIGKIPLSAVDVNMTFLNGQARLMKTDLKYPGVEVYAETTTGVRM